MEIPSALYDLVYILFRFGLRLNLKRMEKTKQSFKHQQNDILLQQLLKKILTRY